MDTLNKRIDELDSLRGIAAIAVVIFHYTTRYAEIFSDTSTISIVSFPYGHYGVELFFIISGFVIFLTINKAKNAFHFFYNRAIRLYPTFWVCLIFTFIILNLFGPNSLKRTLHDFFINFTMIPSLLNAQLVDGVYWSLIPELYFYFFMGFLLIFQQVKRIIFIGYFWLLLMYLNFLLDIPYLNSLDGVLNLKFGMLFLMGINFYHLHFNMSSLHNHIQIILCAIISILPNPSIEYVIIISSFILIFYLFVNSKLKFISIKPLQFFGKISYALYLLHQFIGYMIIYHLLEMGVKNQFLLILFPLLISVALSYMVVKYLEEPSIKKLKPLYSHPLFNKLSFSVKKIPN